MGDRARELAEALATSSYVDEHTRYVCQALIEKWAAEDEADAGTLADRIVVGGVYDGPPLDPDVARVRFEAGLAPEAEKRK